MLPFTILLALLPHAEKPTLTEKLTPLIRAHQGQVAIAVKELKTGETFLHNADKVMPTASLCKLPILIEAFLQLDAKKIKLNDTITLREKDKVPGSGLLTKHFDDGSTFPFKTALHLMIAVSDNTATNLVLDKVGIRAVNARMKSWGLNETRVNAKVFRGSTTSVDPKRTKLYGLGSTTAREMLTLLTRIEEGKPFRPAIKQAILTFLKLTEDKKKFRRYLPSSVTLAHKTGSVSRARTDAGILYLNKTAVILCVLTAKNKDRSWGNRNAGDLLCAKVAKVVYDHFRRD